MWQGAVELILIVVRILVGFWLLNSKDQTPRDFDHQAATLGSLLYLVSGAIIFLKGYYFLENTVYLLVV